MVKMPPLAAAHLGVPEAALAAPVISHHAGSGKSAALEILGFVLQASSGGRTEAVRQLWLRAKHLDRVTRQVPELRSVRRTPEFTMVIGSRVRLAHELGQVLLRGQLAGPPRGPELADSSRSASTPWWSGEAPDPGLRHRRSSDRHALPQPRGSTGFSLAGALEQIFFRYIRPLGWAVARVAQFVFWALKPWLVRYTAPVRAMRFGGGPAGTPRPRAGTRPAAPRAPGAARPLDVHLAEGRSGLLCRAPRGGAVVA